MKKYLFFFLLLLWHLSTFSDSCSEQPVFEYTTEVYFAPSEYAGLYKFQLLSNGVVQKIDNKKNTTQIATFLNSIVDQLKTSIDKIKSTDFIKPEGPICMDAPSHKINVYQSNNKKILIWKNESCREYVSVDFDANNVSKVIKNLSNVLEQIERLNK